MNKVIKVICIKDYPTANIKEGEIIDIGKNLTAPYLNHDGRWEKRYDYTIIRNSMNSSISSMCVLSDSSFYDHFRYIYQWRNNQIDKILS